MAAKTIALIIAILAFVFAPNAAPKQLVLFGSYGPRVQIPNIESPQTVSVRPSRANQPGRKSVVVAVDRSRVRVGETVRFTISSINAERAPITIDFGDGTRIETRRTEVTHTYWATGHYDVYASVSSHENQPGPQQPPSGKPLPGVTLVARPSPVVAGNVVSFRAQLSFDYPGIRYMFVFGDGAQTGWQDGPSSTHTYRSAGTYLAYVDVGLGNKQMGGSMRQSILVSNPTVVPSPTPGPNKPDVVTEPKPGPVQLSANPSQVQIGKSVTLNARATDTNANVRYRFVFGDGKLSGWQADAQTTHTYTTKGNYAARVNMGLLTKGTIRGLSSARQGIQVTNTPSLNVNLTANPIPVEKGQAVSFNATTDSSDSNIRYRFVFGEGAAATGWQTEARTSYTYSTPGTYGAHVEVGRFGNGQIESLAVSSSKTIIVKSSAVASASPKPSQVNGPTPSPSGSGSSIAGSSPTSSPGDNSPASPLNNFPNSWWLYLLFALLLIFVAYRIYLGIFRPRATFHVTRDSGNSEIDAGANGLSINSQVLLRPNLSDAQYLVSSNEPNLVRSVRRENV